MFSKEESKSIKKEFWTKFGGFSQKKRLSLGLDKKWLTHNTGISGLSLKFDFEKNRAMVGIEISSSNKLIEDKYYNKLLSLRKILNESFDEMPEWCPDYSLSDGKQVIKVFHVLENVTIYNKSCWPQVFMFYFEKMLIYESFYIDFKDFIMND